MRGTKFSNNVEGNSHFVLLLLLVVSADIASLKSISIRISTHIHAVDVTEIHGAFGFHRAFSSHSNYTNFTSELHSLLGGLFRKMDTGYDHYDVIIIIQITHSPAMYTSF